MGIERGLEKKEIATGLLSATGEKGLNFSRDALWRFLHGTARRWGCKADAGRARNPRLKRVCQVALGDGRMGWVLVLGR